MKIKRFVPRLLDEISMGLPWPRHTRTCFFNLRPGPGGPRIFAQKLAQELQQQGVCITHNQLRSAEAALLFSKSDGNWFHYWRRRWGIRTVLRVDGFAVPGYFDNRLSPLHYQNRHLTLAHMATNYRLQRDLAQVDYVIYQSAFSKQMADLYLFARHHDYGIVFNGVDLNRFYPGPARADRIRLLSAGALRHEYMLGTVLPLFNRLWQRHNLELMIVGQMDTICEQQLNEFAHAFPTAFERVKIVGEVPNRDLPKIVQQADILVHPRLGDGCPNTVIEAMACGLPVVCGSWGGQAELVGSGGLVVPTQKWSYGKEYIDALADGVEQILGALDQYRIAARTRAISCFDIRQTAQRYVAALELTPQ